MMFTCQEQSSSLPFTCNFLYSYYSLRIVVNFFTAIIHIPHCTAQMIESERTGVLLAAVFIYLRLMQNTFVWLHSTLFCAIEMWWQFVCLRCRRVLFTVSGWGYGTETGGSELFSPFPSIVITGACHVIYVQVHLNKLECCEKVHFFL